MEAEERRKKRDRFLLFFLLISVLCLVLPAVTDCVTELLYLKEVQRDVERVEKRAAGTEQIRNTEKAIRGYNARIAKEQETRPFRYRGELATDGEYEALPVKENRQICYLMIPEIDLCLPVMHGTDASVLNEAAGHMYGTSLPFGGVSTHAVLAAHSGLVRAKLFTDLDHLKKGDSFYIRALGKTRVYRICGKKTVRPEEADACLQVKKGEDLVTLYTCTPLGINSHRLLVTGRFERELNGQSGVSKGNLLRDMERRSMLKLCALLLIPAGVFACAGKYFRDFRNKKECRNRQKTCGNRNAEICIRREDT